MLTAVHATPKPTTTPITKPTKRAITTRLFSRNAFLPNALRHYAPKCLEEVFCELRRYGVLGSSPIKLQIYATWRTRLLLYQCILVLVS
jgi:hypothetical protein